MACPTEIAYALGSYNTARHFRIDHLVGSLTPGRYADVVLLSDPEQVKIKAVYADGAKVSEDYKMLVAVPKIRLAGVGNKDRESRPPN